MPSIATLLGHWFSSDRKLSIRAETTPH
nr:hypothetical protein [Mycobacterium uberis]